ncbi:class I SAM-dependent methyltransferase [Patescibacteria group bacterium]|nr:class I SAM-dependent methyltransferase [Patescibacteria group bacterium]
MSKESWSNTLEYYTETHKSSPGTAKGLDWSEASQQIRFKVLIELIKNRSSKDTVLDVGCGYGDLAQLVNWTPNYYGIDINPLILKTAKKRYPNLDFKQANLLDVKEKYDWILSSGAFNVKSDNNEELLQLSIKKMWELCRKGVVLNILVKGSPVKNANMYFYDPGKVLNYCRSLTSKVVCRIDYLPHDATFYLYR